MPAPHYGILDNACPLNWAHPTNVGCVGKWLVPPLAGWSGGKTLRDLVRGGRNPHDGTLTNFTFSSTNGWRAGARLGGWGSLIFTTNIYVALPSFGTLTAFSIGGWFTKLGGTTQRYLGSSAGAYGEVEIEPFSDNIIYAYMGGAGVGVNSTAVADTNWHHVFLVFDGSQTGNTNRLKIYLDGVNATAGSFGTVPASIAWTGPRIGDTTNSLKGQADDVTRYDHALSAASVRALYEASRRGYPDELRWIRGTVFSFPGAKAGGLLLRRRRAVA